MENSCPDEFIADCLNEWVTGSGSLGTLFRLVIAARLIAVSNPLSMK